MTLGPDGGATAQPPRATAAANPIASVERAMPTLLRCPRLHISRERPAKPPVGSGSLVTIRLCLRADNRSLVQCNGVAAPSLPYDAPGMPSASVKRLNQVTAQDHDLLSEPHGWYGASALARPAGGRADESPPAAAANG